MERTCKNCKHFNPDTSICDWTDLIKFENDWCYSFFAKEKEKNMAVFNFETGTFNFEILSENELKDFIKTAQAELSQRERKRRETLRNAFISAWRKLEEDGGSIYVCGEHINLDEDVEIY